MRRLGPFAIPVVVVISTALAQAFYSVTRDDSQNALDPVRTALGETATILDSAIAEARFDGTADAAEERADLLQEFVRGLSQRQRWPSGSAGAETPPIVYDLVVALADIIQLIPSQIGFVERNDARCDAWSGNATAAERIRWGQESWPARGRMFLVHERLISTANQLEAYVDVAPLRNAASQLQAWLVDVAPAFEACLPAPDDVFLQLFPSTTIPTGRVQAYVGMGKPSPGTRVRLESAPMRLSVEVLLNAAGTSSHAFEVPLETPLGAYPITATFPNDTAAANLLVTQAASRLVLTYPARVLPTTTFALTARVETAIQGRAATGPVAVTGSLNANQPIGPTSAIFTFRSPDQPTNLTGTVHYPGDALQLPADASYRIRVRLATQPDESDPTGAAHAKPPTRVHGVLDLELDLAALSQLLLLGPLLFLVFIAADLAAGRQARRVPGPVAELTDPFLRGRRRRFGNEELPAEAGRPGLVQSFLGFLAWLIRRGQAHPSQTAREAAQALKAYGANPDPVVGVFERVRYGGQEAPPRVHGLLPRWIKMVWYRLRGS